MSVVCSSDLFQFFEYMYIYEDQFSSTHCIDSFRGEKVGINTNFIKTLLFPSQKHNQLYSTCDPLIKSRFGTDICLS